MTVFRWFLAAAISALAAFLTLQHGTPVDRALPLIAVSATLLAAVSYSSVMVAVPLLLIAELAIGDESFRLLAFGAIMAAAFSASTLALPRRRDDTRGVEQGLVLAAVGIFLVRWIPVEDVLIWRELALLGAALFIVVVLDGTPLAVAIALATAMATPAVPLRTLALPLAVIAVAVALRAAGMPRLALTWPAATLVGFVLLFFPWSGVVARALPYFLSERRPARMSAPYFQALASGESSTLQVPAGATSLIVSGANVSRLPAGELLGRIDPGGVEIRVGDAADWGYMRRDQFHESRNPLPRDPAGEIRGYGYKAWVDGAGRVALPRGATTVRVTAASTIPHGAALQVQGFESGTR